tara:strand:- start:3520 stop:3747 length:228 start_codon:yes stop_codon:yes gene_type:complete
MNPEPRTMNAEEAKEVTFKQATELSDLQEHIITNVAKRKWNKEQLHKELDNLYLLGMAHGNQIGMPFNINTTKQK